MFKLNNLLRTFVFPILLVADYSWMLGYGWFSLITFIILLLVTGILIMYSVGIKQIEYFVLLSLILGNASLMIHELFQISVLNFLAVSMFFFVIGTFLSIRLIVDSIEEYNNS
jgi:hypothetical protein